MIISKRGREEWDGIGTDYDVRRRPWLGGWADREGRGLATRDRAGRWSRTLYNPRRQPVIEVAPNGDLTRFEWCLCGQLQKLTDPLGRETKWTWTIGGRNTEKLLPDGVTKTTYTYQPRSGRLSTMTQPNNQGGAPTATYSYQLDGRLKTEDYTDNSATTGASDVTYNYEPASLGRLTSVVDGSVTHSFSYVPLTQGTAGAGRLEFVNGPLTNDRIQNVYDWQNRALTANLLEDATTTVLRTETYTVDTLGRLSTVANTLGTGPHTFGYNPTKPGPESLTGPNGVTSTFAYNLNNAPGDSAQALASITHVRSAVQQAKHVYGYDTAGRITGWEQQSIGQNTAKTAYQYNLKDELVQTEDTDLSNGNTLLDRETWGLDAAGNWLSRSRTATSLMETRTNDSLNRLVQIGGAPEVFSSPPHRSLAKCKTFSGRSLPFHRGQSPACTLTSVHESFLRPRHTGDGQTGDRRQRSIHFCGDRLSAFRVNDDHWNKA